jgi:hypothetical protein
VPAAALVAGIVLARLLRHQSPQSVRSSPTTLPSSADDRLFK